MSHPSASGQVNPELPHSFLGQEGLGISESGRLGDMSQEEEVAKDNLSITGWTVRGSYSLAHQPQIPHTPPSNFFHPKKKVLCEKQGPSGPGVTTASSAPLPACVRRTLAVTPPPPFPRPQGWRGGKEDQEMRPLGFPHFPIAAPLSPSLILSTH